MSWSKHLPGMKSNGPPPETKEEKTARIEAAAAQRRKNIVRHYEPPAPEEVWERMKRRSRRTKRDIADDRYHTKVKYDLDELNLTALRAPHVVREMSLSSKGGRKRSKTRKQRRHRR